MNPKLKRILEKQHYKIVGDHSGVKICHWLRQKLLHGRVCYKEAFYGIESHRCLQMTPTINQCTQKCLFCWRFQGFSETDLTTADDPQVILDQSISAQQILTSGFKGDHRVDLKLWQEAQQPNQVAISLSGEPTLYPKLGAFIDVCHKRNMTTFLVTNGTNPKALENLDPLPTQLYVSVTAPNPEIYKKLCVPVEPIRKKGWVLLNQTLELLPSLSTRTVIRHTLVDGWNLGWENEYAKLIEKADPLFVEPKAYVFVGYSRKRMTIANMPSHLKIKQFGEKLAGLTGYELAKEKADSRVVLLTKNPNKILIK
jgi:tRNA wybutosine-synthesizing protein 1